MNIGPAGFCPTAASEARISLTAGPTSDWIFSRGQVMWITAAVSCCDWAISGASIITFSSSAIAKLT
jgi:hypothetical protein